MGTYTLISIQGNLLQTHPLCHNAMLTQALEVVISFNASRQTVQSISSINTLIFFHTNVAFGEALTMVIISFPLPQTCETNYFH